MYYKIITWINDNFDNRTDQETKRKDNESTKTLIKI